MLAVGAKVINPRTGTEFELLEMSETGFVLRSAIPGGMTTPDFDAHVHHGWDEEIVIHSGQGAYIKGGRAVWLRPAKASHFQSACRIRIRGIPARSHW